MKLIPLGEVEEYLLKYTSLYSYEISDILSKIPTIDPIAIIDKMIEEIHKKLEDIDPDTDIFWEEELDKLLWKKMWLLELKSRLSTNL